MGKKSLKQRATQKKRAPGWHGGKNLRPSYEGQQYSGGRQKGRKNLKKLENGNLQNQYGVEFTQEDKKKLESMVNRANRKRMQMLEKEGDLPRLVGGKDTGQKVSQLQLMGKESDFILARKSKSMQRFKSREDFEKYLSNVERSLSPDYIDERTRLYKKSHITALKNAFGAEATDIITQIQFMKPEDYRELIQSDEDLEVSYLYGPEAMEAKLEQMRASLQGFRQRQKAKRQEAKAKAKKV